MELVLLQVLDERAAGAVHDALGDAGGPGGIEDVERMVERQGRKVQRRRLSLREAVPGHRVPEAVEGRLTLDVRDDDDAFDGRQLGEGCGDPRAEVMGLDRK